MSDIATEMEKEFHAAHSADARAKVLARYMAGVGAPGPVMPYFVTDEHAKVVEMCRIDNNYTLMPNSLFMHVRDHARCRAVVTAANRCPPPAVRSAASHPSLTLPRSARRRVLLPFGCTHSYVHACVCVCVVAPAVTSACSLCVYARARST